jgi:ribosomal protein S18 acetylase RimI-like enzyme
MVLLVRSRVTPESSGVVKEGPVWKIRKAAGADAAALHDIAETTFRETFGPFNTREDMDLHCSRFFTPEAQARELEDRSIETLVVDDPAPGSSRLIAYAQLRSGPAPSGVDADSPLEIQRFYVRSGFRGTGLAQALMTAAVERARERGAGALWLGVWEKNPRAFRFYEKCGFLEFGAHTFVLGTDPQRDLLMRRDLREDVRAAGGAT